MRAISALTLFPAAGFAAAAAVAAAAACLPLTVQPTAQSFGPHFASWNVDPSRDRLFFDTDWKDPQLLYLLENIGTHAHLRFGGTGENYLWYEVPGAPPCPPSTATQECLNSSTWRALGALATAAQTPLIFGLNLFPAYSRPPPGGPWNSSNARALLTDAAAHKVPIGYVELGCVCSERRRAPAAAAARCCAIPARPTTGTRPLPLPRPRPRQRGTRRRRRPQRACSRPLRPLQRPQRPRQHQRTRLRLRPCPRPRPRPRRRRRAFSSTASAAAATRFSAAAC
jgi:hypothetical protein